MHARDGTQVKDMTGEIKTLSKFSSKTQPSEGVEEARIRNVWADNLREEIDQIMDVVEVYNYVAVDTEFPGIVCRPVGSFKDHYVYRYQTLRLNVDMLKIIQLGFTFLDEEGNLPEGICTWQFNFKWDYSQDIYAQDSIELLHKAGLDFEKHQLHGVDPFEFGELIMMSGVVLTPDVKWLSFHGGYDFAYLLTILRGLQSMPTSEEDFFELLRLYFPTLFDLKYLMKSCETLHGGLQTLGDKLELKRIGQQHQAGSDSFITGLCFFKMRQLFFEDIVEEDKFANVLYGLGSSRMFKPSSIKERGR